MEILFMKKILGAVKQKCKYSPLVCMMHNFFKKEGVKYVKF